MEHDIRFVKISVTEEHPSRENNITFHAPHAVEKAKMCLDNINDLLENKNEYKVESGD